MSILTPGDLSALRVRWSEPHRAYHTPQHLDECLAQLETHVALTQDAEAVEAALWLHDAVYDSRRDDNEARSAALAREMLAAHDVAEARIARVEAMIRATTHTAISADADTRLLCDIDLAILGAAPRRFAEYEMQIRQEYAWVPISVYRATRAAVLDRLLSRPTLYQTPVFRELLEAQARENLGRSISALRAAGGPK